MRDDRHPLHWLDLSWLAPLPVSMGLAIWALITRPDPGQLGVLLLVQMALMASACSLPAGIAARRSQVWWRRLAPSGFATAVHRSWREHTLILLGLGLLGPVAAAVRAYDMGAVALACWALALPLLGAMLGTLASWAWSGSLRPVGLALVPVMAGAAWMMGRQPAAWVDATGLAVASGGAGLLLLAWAWRASQRLQPRWAGVGPLLARWRRRPAASVQRWQWDALAFDDDTIDPPQGWARLWSQYLLYAFIGLSGNTPLQGLLPARIEGMASLHAALYFIYLFVLAGPGLLVRVAHWRLHLAPGGMPHGNQVALMLAASTAWLAAMTAGVASVQAWREGIGLAAMALPLLRMAVDATLCVGLAAWLRSLANRSAFVMLVWLGLTLGLAGLLWLLHEADVAIPRGPGSLAGEAAVAALLMGLAYRGWRRRVLRGAGQLARERAD